MNHIDNLLLFEFSPVSSGKIPAASNISVDGSRPANSQAVMSIIGKISELRDQDEKEVEQIILDNTIDVLGNRWDAVLKYVPEAQDATVLK